MSSPSSSSHALWGSISLFTTAHEAVFYPNTLEYVLGAEMDRRELSDEQKNIYWSYIYDFLGSIEKNPANITEFDIQIYLEERLESELDREYVKNILRMLFIKILRGDVI